MALARLEAVGRLDAVITQNIDNLHQMAGSKNVIEYHGGMGRYHCMSCRAGHDPREAARLTSRDIPWRCGNCGGVVRPDIVFFGESIPLDALRKSGQLALAADFLLVVGTSGEVAPANTLPYQVQGRGGVVVEINPGESAYAAMPLSSYRLARVALLFWRNSFRRADGRPCQVEVGLWMR
jgi:NAD-dependent deacetylase